jgi:hypothetical protein
MAWTTPRTWTSYELVTAALLNTHVRDNLAFFASTRYIPIPLSTAYYDSGTMGGFLTSATINVAKDEGVGTTNLTTFPYQSIIFPDSGTTGVAFNFHVPPDYGGTPVLKFTAYNAGTTIDSTSAAVFVAYVGAIANLGVDIVGGTTIQANTGGAVISGSMILERTVFDGGLIPLTNTGGLAAGRSAALYLVRTPAAANDNVGKDVGIIDIWLEYSPAAA